ncbi:MAG: hypothetical protein ACFFA1_01070 [Promethearchaeota archaeon]
MPRKKRAKKKKEKEAEEEIPEVKTEEAEKQFFGRAEVIYKTSPNFIVRLWWIFLVSLAVAAIGVVRLVLSGFSTFFDIIMPITTVVTTFNTLYLYIGLTGILFFIAIVVLSRYVGKHRMVAYTLLGISVFFLIRIIENNFTAIILPAIDVSLPFYTGIIYWAMVIQVFIVPFLLERVNKDLERIYVATRFGFLLDSGWLRDWDIIPYFIIGGVEIEMPSNPIRKFFHWIFKLSDIKVFFRRKIEIKGDTTRYYRFRDYPNGPDLVRMLKRYRYRLTYLHKRLPGIKYWQDRRKIIRKIRDGKGPLILSPDVLEEIKDKRQR